MFEVLDRMYVMAMCAANRFWTEEKGAVDLVTIVVLIGVAVALAVIFRNQVSNLINSLFSTIGGNAEEAIK